MTREAPIRSNPGPTVAISERLSHKLFRSHMTVGMIGVAMLLVALGMTLWVRSYMVGLAGARAPAALASVRLVKGLERSHAALHGWVVAGDPAFRLARESAWDDEVFPMLAALQGHATDDAWLGLDQSLRELPNLLFDLNELQWWIEDVAQTPGNEPLTELCFRTVDPVALRAKARITALIEEQKVSGEPENMAQILGAMADLRATLLSSWNAIEVFRTLGSPAALLEYRAESKSCEASLAILLDHRDALTSEQKVMLADVKRDLVAFGSAAEAVIDTSRTSNVNVAREMLVSQAVPLGSRIHGVLGPLSDEQVVMMQSDAQRVASLSNVGIGVCVALVACSLLVAGFVSRQGAKRITSPVEALAAATQQVVAGTLHEDLPVRSNDEVGHLTGAFNSMRNSLEISESALRLQKAALDTHSIVAITDVAGRITYANDKFCEISKYSREELLGQDHRIINSGHHPAPFMKRLWRKIVCGEIWQGEIKNRAKDGSYYWVDTTIVPFRDRAGRITQFVAIRTDITDRRAAEADLVSAKEAAEAANLAKSEFLANMSHEIRTPLHGILSFSRFGADEIHSGKTDDLAGHFENISQSGTRLLRLINDLLDLAKLESGKMQYEFADGDFSDMVRRVVSEFDLLRQEREISMNVSMPAESATWTYDEHCMGQVVRNLVSNSVKFSSNAGTIDVSVTHKDSALVFSVRDSGVGIPEDELDVVFDKFVQSSKTKTGAGGTGLGLSICSEIVAAHGGRIWAENHPDGGAIFCIELPRTVRSYIGDAASTVDQSKEQAEAPC